MNRDDVIRMAREAGLPFGTTLPYNYEVFAHLIAAAERERLTAAAFVAAEKGIDAAMAAEREACAKVCEAYCDGYGASGREFANIIRARSQS